ncbi:uncharacterized protein QC763_200499 [Podospora pseudopauciseta]|uniref:Uncharacterized protein n=2 Tax=Podospora TaxID=5144 RepID=A0ABY6S0K4_PODCO|nr:hypothetical protein QC763_200499 [Podospora pseudopauciseta]VBB75067.1 Putative protein of unknown function [Podospora comata]
MDHLNHPNHTTPAAREGHLKRVQICSWLGYLRRVAFPPFQHSTMASKPRFSPLVTSACPTCGWIPRIHYTLTTPHPLPLIMKS